MITRILLALLICFQFGAAHALDALPNMELSKLAGEDQTVRQHATDKTDWKEIMKADAIRRNRVMEIFNQGGIRVGLDYENAALILMHSLDIRDQRLSHAFATLALATDSKRYMSRSIARASWDRMMIMVGKKQWYGTQNLKGTPPPIPFPPNID